MMQHVRNLREQDDAVQEKAAGSEPWYIHLFFSVLSNNTKSFLEILLIQFPTVITWDAHHTTQVSDQASLIRPTNN